MKTKKKEKSINEFYIDAVNAYEENRNENVVKLL